MDPAKFYGSRKKVADAVFMKVREIPDESEDSCLSNSEDEDDNEPLSSLQIVKRSEGFPIIEQELIEEEIEMDGIGEIREEKPSDEDVDSIDENVEHETTTSASRQKQRSTTVSQKWEDVKSDNSEKILPLWFGDIPNTEELKTPIGYFRQFFDYILLDQIVEQSNLYSVQINPNKPLKLNKSELEQFFGCVIYMSVFNLPRSRMFWAKNSRVNQVADVMSRDRWEAIKNNLHLNDNTQAPQTTDPQRDKLYKIRPLIDNLQSKFLKIPQQQMQSIDEQMVPFKGHSGLKQYLPKKPYKWGYKIFVICDTRGLVHNFEIFTGKIDKVAGYPDLGASSNIVLKLVQNLQTNVNHLLFCDNWFSSEKLFIELAKKGFLALGTIRVNRFPELNFSNDKYLKKKGRGTFEEKTTTIDNVELRAVKWFDNRSVHLASTFSSAQPTSTVKRWDRNSKSFIEILCPQMVRLYNSFMGGVDALDATISYYRIHIRSKKWYHRLIFHFIDLVIVNCWLLYCRDCESLQIAKKCRMDLLEFRTQIAESLCKEGKDTTARKRGRPSTSSIQQKYEIKKKRGPTTSIPSTNVRQDGMHHWPVIKPTRQRCKKPNYKGQTNVFCEKCEVNLCLNKNSNCFKDFHRD